MAPQLTLQAPLELPPQDVSDYLGRLWNGGEQDATSSGAATFSPDFNFSTGMLWLLSHACLICHGDQR